MNKNLWVLAIVLTGCLPDTEVKELPPTAATCSATITWEPPATRVNDNPLKTEELEKYTVYINRRDTVEDSSLLLVVDITDINLITFVISEVPKGVKYFYMTTTDTEGRVSTYSNIEKQVC